MFDIGFLELLIIGVVALVVVGPERLPGLVKTIGLWVGRIRRMLSGVKREISEELRIEELRQQAKAREQEIKENVDAVTKPFSETLRDDVLSARRPVDTAEPSISSAPSVAASIPEQSEVKPVEGASEKPS